MLGKPLYTLAAGAILLCGAAGLRAREGKEIKIPMRSRLTPVQRLNREGVEAVKKHQYEKAEGLFYKAYLYDPSDPFTLNNLGYVAELEGQLERARSFYDLAAEQGSDAEIDFSSAKHLQGKPMKTALVDLQDSAMRVNRTNVNAMRLLSQDRGFEAVAVLKAALPLEPKNPFTLNNLGVASEAIGDFEGALRYYREAAATQSSEPLAITTDASWRGKSVSAAAAASANRLEIRLRDTKPAQAQAIMFTLRGVNAANENDWQTAREDFLRAYSLDPESAFSLNNRGYVAEKDGDLETAQFFYEKARRANGAAARVGLATDLSAQGKRIVLVAEDSNKKVDSALDRYAQQRRQEPAPVELTPRGEGAGNESTPQTQPVPNAPGSVPPSAPPNAH